MRSPPLTDCSGKLELAVLVVAALFGGLKGSWLELTGTLEAATAATAAFAKQRPEKRTPAALAATPRDSSVGRAPAVESGTVSVAVAVLVSPCAPPDAKP